MNLQLWVRALLLLWLSLTAVCGGECAPSVRPRPLPRSPPPGAWRSAGQEQPRTRRQVAGRPRPGTGRLRPRASLDRRLAPPGCPSQS